MLDQPQEESKPMIVEFDQIRITVKNPEIQNVLKQYLLRKTGKGLPAYLKKELSMGRYAKRTHMVWTNEEIEKIVNAYKIGLTPTAIGNLFPERTKSSIHTFLERNFHTSSTFYHPAQKVLAVIAAWDAAHQPAPQQQDVQVDMDEFVL